ncbi:hypothetical protein Hanom_Chr07g00596391 [Helianthus anomalus]
MFEQYSIFLLMVNEFGLIFYFLFGCMSLKENTEKKVKARAQQKINSKNGSKSTIRYHIERGLDLESSTGQIMTWRLTHWDAKNGLMSTDADAKYVTLLVRFYAKYQLLDI